MRQWSDAISLDAPRRIIASERGGIHIPFAVLIVVAVAVTARTGIGDVGDVYVSQFWGPDVEQYDVTTREREHTYFQSVAGDNGGSVHWLHQSNKLLLTRTTGQVHWTNPKETVSGVAVRDPDVSQPMDTAIGPHGRLLVANRGTESITAHVWDHASVEPARAKNVDEEWDLPTKGFPAILMECAAPSGFQRSCPGEIDILVAVQGNHRGILGLDIDSGIWTTFAKDLTFEDGPLDMDWHPTLARGILIGTRLNGLKVLDLDSGALTTLVNRSQVFGAVGRSETGRAIGAVEGVAVNPWLGANGIIIISDRCETCLSENRLMNFSSDGTFLAEYAIGDFSGDLAIRLPEPTTCFLLIATSMGLTRRRRKPVHHRADRKDPAERKGKRHARHDPRPARSSDRSSLGHHGR